MKLKKVLALICACALIGAMLSGCGIFEEETATEATESGYIQSVQ